MTAPLISLWNTLTGWFASTSAWTAGHWWLFVICAVAALVMGLVVSVLERT